MRIMRSYLKMSKPGRIDPVVIAAIVVSRNGSEKEVVFLHSSVLGQLQQLAEKGLRILLLTR